VAAKYRKIDPRIWNDEKFRRLDDRQKLVVLELLTGQSNRCGLFYFSAALGGERLGWSPELWLATAKSACAVMEWPLDEPSRCVLIPKWWRYNDPKNAKTLRGCLKDLEDLPKTPLIDRYPETSQYLSVALKKWIDPEDPTLGAQMRTQEQEQEQEQEQDEEPLTPRSGESFSLRSGKPNPRALGTNPRALAAKAKANEIKRRTRLLARIIKCADKTLADGTEVQSVGIYRGKRGGLLTWDRVSTKILETLAKEIEKE